MVQQHAASFIAHTEASTGAALPRFIKDEFDAFLEWPVIEKILTHLGLDPEPPPRGRTHEAGRD